MLDMKNFNLTLGFTCNPEFLKTLIMNISLGGKFPKIVLNFEDERVWWANRADGFFVYNFGFFSHSCVDSCWGKGSVGLETSKLLEFFKKLREYKKITFFIDPDKNIFGLFTGDKDKAIELFTYNTIAIEKIKTATQIMKLDENYSPVIPLAQDEDKLKYGGDIEIKSKEKYLSSIIKIANYFCTNVIIVKLIPKPDTLIFELSGNNGVNQKVFRTESNNISKLKVPVEKKEYAISCEEFKFVEKSYHNDKKITILFTGNNQRPIYFLKRQENDLNTFISGALIGTREIPQLKKEILYLKENSNMI